MRKKKTPEELAAEAEAEDEDEFTSNVHNFISHLIKIILINQIKDPLSKRKPKKILY